MNPMIKFPSIGQFRDAIKQIQSSAKYANKPVPTLKLTGFPKVHGSNGGIIRKVGGGVEDIYFQSRERVLSIESDNAGFCFWGHSIRNELNEMFNRIEKACPGKTGYVQVFGEWAGGSIQKGVGVTGLDKFFMVFGIRISEDAECTTWEPKAVYDEVFKFEIHPSIYDKYFFKTWKLKIDFNCPGLMQNELVRITEEVEKDCPVARYFKPNAEMGSLIGEGAVWVIEEGQDCGFDVSSVMLKVKGEKHSVSKVRTVASVDVEKVKSIADFVEYAVTENRLEQMFQKAQELQLELSTKSTGTFLRLVQADVIKEELDTMVASQIEPKDIGSQVATKSREFWFKKLEEAVKLA